MLGFVFFWAAIWISQKAKPLGNMPYRWGAYLGLMAAWMSLLSIVSSILAIDGGHVLGGSVLCFVAVLAAVSGFGLLRRRKFGVVVYGLVHAMLILLSPFLEPIRGQPFLMAIRNTPASPTELAGQMKSFPSLVALVLFAVYFVFTFVYFKDRWSLMGKVTDPLPQTFPDSENQD
ncbi:MAG: hypothetical protein ACLQBJ_12530 [Bryobacteraceae bacterium]